MSLGIATNVFFLSRTRLSPTSLPTLGGMSILVGCITTGIRFCSISQVCTSRTTARGAGVAVAWANLSFLSGTNLRPGFLIVNVGIYGTMSISLSSLLPTKIIHRIFFVLTMMGQLLLSRCRRPWLLSMPSLVESLLTLQYPPLTRSSQGKFFLMDLSLISFTRLAVSTFWLIYIARSVSSASVMMTSPHPHLFHLQ